MGNPALYQSKVEFGPIGICYIRRYFDQHRKYFDGVIIFHGKIFPFLARQNGYPYWGKIGVIFERAEFP